jgi:hypothetical protein
MFFEIIRERENPMGPPTNPETYSKKEKATLDNK